MNPGRFIAFEGIEGSGKSTQLSLLRDRLESLGRQVITIREPGGTPIGDRIRSILLDPGSSAMAAETEMLLFAASRSQLVREVISPRLADGWVVLCDRYLHSSLAYQAAARALGRELVLQVNAPATGGLLPHKVVLIDLDPGEAMGRARSRAGLDRIEQEDLSFHEAVRSGYLIEAEQDPERFLVVDGCGEPDVVQSRITPALEAWIAAQGAGT